MIHFIYLIVFAVGIAIVFGCVTPGTPREKVIQGLKSFGQFVVISLVMAWIFYFIPW